MSRVCDVPTVPPWQHCLLLVPLCVLDMVAQILMRASAGTVSCMQGFSKRPVRPVLMKMPPQTAALQWGYTQIWREGMRHYTRSSPRTCSIDPKIDIESQNLRRSASASRLTSRTQECSNLEPVSSSRVDGDGKAGRRGKKINDGTTRASRARSQDWIHTLRCSGIYETIGSGVAHKVPSTGEYYGIGRFTPACYTLGPGLDNPRSGQDN